MRVNITFALVLVRAMMLDGYTCKSPPPLFGLHPSAHAADSLSVSAYNATDVLPVRSRSRFTRPHLLTARRTTCLSALAYNAMVDSSMLPLMLRSSLLSVSHGLVYINTPGRTFLHELFIEYEQVTAWVARFFFQQNGGKLSYTINRRLHWMAQWAGAQVAATTILVKLQIASWKEPLAELLTRLVWDHLEPAAVTSTFCGFTSHYQHQ